MGHFRIAIFNKYHRRTNKKVETVRAFKSNDTQDELKMNSTSSSVNGLRGLWLQILIIHSRHSGFGNKLETSLKITQHFLIVHELIKATFEDLYIFSFDYSLRQVIPDINDSMRETIPPISKRAPFLKILRECPLVTLFFLKRIRFWHLGRTFFVRILNISIKSPRSLLYYKVGNLRFLILSSYVKPLKPGMSLVARLWTFSITSTWRLNLGAQTELAFSKCGLTNALYRRRKGYSSRCMNDLLIRPTIPIALVILSDTCLSKISSISIVTPRSFSGSAISNWCCLSV